MGVAGKYFPMFTVTVRSRCTPVHASHGLLSFSLPAKIVFQTFYPGLHYLLQKLHSLSSLKSKEYFLLSRKLHDPYALPFCQEEKRRIVKYKLNIGHQQMHFSLAAFLIVLTTCLDIYLLSTKTKDGVKNSFSFCFMYGLRKSKCNVLCCHQCTCSTLIYAK